MSGIAENAPNKFVSCQGCKDRRIEPTNCHTTCQGYLFRQKKNEEERQRRRADSQYVAFKRKAISETIEKVSR